MKKVIFQLVAFACFFGQLSAQDYSLKYFIGGGGFDRFSTVSNPSDSDSLIYSISTLSNDNRFSLTLLTLGIKDSLGNFTEIGIGYSQGKQQVGRNSGGVDFSQRGDYLTRAFAIDLERYFQYQKLEAEKIRTYWGWGINSMYETGEIIPLENTLVYSNKRQRIGFGATFLTRLIYGDQDDRWKIEGTFGILPIEFFYIDSYLDNPILSENQKRSGVFEMNMPLEAFAQLGVSFVLNHKKSKQKDK